MDHESAILEVEVFLLPTGAGGRKAPVSLGYRPNHKHPRTGEYFMGELTFSGALKPGDSARAQMRVIASSCLIAEIVELGSWTIWEGPHHVGSIRILR